MLKVKPLVESIADPLPKSASDLVWRGSIRRSRCILHRRYLISRQFRRRRHSTSRRTCREVALALLDYQGTIYRATLCRAVFCDRMAGLLRHWPFMIFSPRP